GFMLGRALATRTLDQIRKIYADLAEQVAKGMLSAPVEKVYPIEEIKAALAHAQRGERHGKILVAPTGSVCAVEQREHSEGLHRMRFGLFGSAQAKRGGPDTDRGAGFRDFVELNVEAEALGFVSSFLVEHHFTGFGQVSATLNLLTWVGARTTTLRLGTAV